MNCYKLGGINSSRDQKFAVGFMGLKSRCQPGPPAPLTQALRENLFLAFKVIYNLGLSGREDVTALGVTKWPKRLRGRTVSRARPSWEVRLGDCPSSHSESG